MRATTGRTVGMLMISLVIGGVVMRLARGPDTDAPPPTSTWNEASQGALKIGSALDKWRLAQLEQRKRPTYPVVGPINWELLGLDPADFDGRAFNRNDYRFESADPRKGTWVISVEAADGDPPGKWTLNDRAALTGPRR